MTAAGSASRAPVRDPIERTIRLAQSNVQAGGRPFACVILRGEELIAESPNRVAQTKDPTARAEMLAIREASQRLQSETLTDCAIYVLAHPRPMCLAALYYSSPMQVTFLTLREDYIAYYRDDRRYFVMEELYAEVGRSWDQRRLPMTYQPVDLALNVYRQWRDLNP